MTNRQIQLADISSFESLGQCHSIPTSTVFVSNGIGAVGGLLARLLPSGGMRAMLVRELRKRGIPLTAKTLMWIAGMMNPNTLGEPYDVTYPGYENVAESVETTDSGYDYGVPPFEE